LVVDVVVPPPAWETTRVEVAVPLDPLAVKRYVCEWPSQANGTEALPLAG
jgi:hypothetical protein